MANAIQICAGTQQCMPAMVVVSNVVYSWNKWRRYSSTLSDLFHDATVRHGNTLLQEATAHVQHTRSIPGIFLVCIFLEFCSLNSSLGRGGGRSDIAWTISSRVTTVRRAHAHRPPMLAGTTLSSNKRFDQEGH